MGSFHVNKQFHIVVFLNDFVIFHCMYLLYIKTLNIYSIPSMGLGIRHTGACPHGPYLNWVYSLMKEKDFK